MCTCTHPFSISWKQLDDLHCSLDVVIGQLAWHFTKVKGGEHQVTRVENTAAHVHTPTPMAVLPKCYQFAENLLYIIA